MPYGFAITTLTIRVNHTVHIRKVTMKSNCGEIARVAGPNHSETCLVIFDFQSSGGSLGQLEETSKEVIGVIKKNKECEQLDKVN
jgi:hypothetical protein